MAKPHDPSPAGANEAAYVVARPETVAVAVGTFGRDHRFDERRDRRRVFG